MKNMIEVPSEKDFHRTTSVEITQDHNGLYKIHYRKANIAMKSITDFTSCENEFLVVDEEKMPEWEKQMEVFKEKCKAKPFGQHQVGPEFEEMDILERPEYPTKKVKIIGTIISYYSTAQRIIVDDFEEFESKYFEYLKMQRLDLQD